MDNNKILEKLKENKESSFPETTEPEKFPEAKPENRPTVTGPTAIEAALADTVEPVKPVDQVAIDQGELGAAPDKNADPDAPVIAASNEVKKLAAGRKESEIEANDPYWAAVQKLRRLYHQAKK